MSGLAWGGLEEIVVVGAHCDDAAIGCGATLLTLCRANPGLRVRFLTLTGGGSDREGEERAALAALTPEADTEITVLDLPDTRLPVHWAEVKDAVNALARRARPDLVLGPQASDAHQDHRTVAEILPTAFRDHLILGYEILKWESDLPATTVYHPVSSETAAEKARALVDGYPSQRAHDWFDEESFLALMRIRGAQSHSRYAEAFVGGKIVVDTASGRQR